MSCPARICCKARTPFPLSVVSYTSMLGKLSGLQISGRSFVRMDRLSCVVPCSCCSLYAATYLINVSLFVLNTSLFVFDADRATRFVSVRLSRVSGLLGIRTAVKDANIAKHNAIMNAIARIVIVLCFDLFL